MATYEGQDGALLHYDMRGESSTSPLIVLAGGAARHPDYLGNLAGVEVGHVALSPALQGTTAATEAMVLLMSLVFDDLGYRRYEWKCDALNAPSRRAATRLDFIYEGTLRQAVIVKGRNRDTAWFPSSTPSGRA